MEKPRYIVIQFATMLEEISSLCLCELLNIDKSQSTSFGYKSQSLSFNSKINLLSDISGTDSEIKGKFQIFSEIRNKFAHVHSVSSFKALCDLDDTLKKKCKKLLDEYKGESYKKDALGYPEEEIIYIAAFLHLFKQLEKHILTIMAKNRDKKENEKGKLEYLEKFHDDITKDLYKNDEGIEILGNFYKTLK